MKKYLSLSLLILLSGCAFALNEKAPKANAFNYEIYPDHLNFLCEDVVLPNGKNSLLTHIYCEAPDYKYTPAPGEGISCIDDVARAGVFYADYYKKTKDKAYLDKVKRCAEFVLFLHQLNKEVPGYGYFYNFVDKKDGEIIINKNGQTSVSGPNWWTWRAMWFLGYIYPEIKESSSGLALRIVTSLNITVAQMQKDFNFKGDVKSEKGISYADWLPNDAADQAAIILMALAYYNKVQPNPEVEKMMNGIAKGLLVGQIGKAKSSDIYGAFMCWKNVWHGWGNNIAYSLLLAGKVLKNPKYIEAALKEIDYFQKYLIKIDYLKEFNIEYKKSGNEEKGSVVMIPDTERKFEQIAYAMRPMIYACIEAYEITENIKYYDQALILAGWFFGENPAKVVMYNPLPKIRKGIVFDGIDSADKGANKNSGAESTIEALLALQKIRSVKNK